MSGVARVVSIERDKFLAALEFAPDRFQLEGFDAIDDGDNVLIAAPTSSGKTLVAQYGIASALRDAKRVFYTTPIKALSNQKFADLSRWLGPDRVGLLTGDNVIRGDADVVVMTTEVLRNMIYSESPALANLGFVILDEVHYLQDSYRGPVWEEVIIQTPQDVGLISLSATVSNAVELADWIAEVRGSCRCVIETTRPVDLQPRILVADRVSNVIEDMLLLSDGRANVETARFIERRSGDTRQRGRRRLARPRRIEIIDHLYDAERLPAIFFIFSRKGCEEAVRQVLDAGIDFLDASERKRVEAIFAEHTSQLSEADLEVLDAGEVLAGLLSGVGAHHAGMVPPFKEAVEACFIAGLLRVVFATETLALGVNMPARSVVIEQLSRFRGEGHVMLTSADFAQLTGRAGRRGIDEVGFACVLWSPFVSFDDAAALAASRDFELRSVFRPTYNMAANLVATRTEQGAVELLEQSFAQFQHNREIVTLTRRLLTSRSELTAAEDGYRGLYGSLDPPKGSESPSLARQTQRSDLSAVESVFEDLKPGDVIAEDQRRGRTSLVVIGVSQRKNTPTRIRVVTPRGKAMMLSAADFGSVPKLLDRIELPTPYQPARREFQKAAAAMLRRSTPSSAVPRVAVRTAQPGDRASEHQLLARLAHEIARTERRLDTAGHGLGRSLRSIVEVLTEFGYVDGWALSSRGELLRRIFNEHDLWVAEAVLSGVLDGLDPARLAAVVSAMTFQRRGPGPAPTAWYPDGEIADRVAELRAIARRLSRSERAAGLAETPDPEPDFVPVAHAWALGIDLTELLAEEELTGGDFVRNIRQLVDLLRQIADVAPKSKTRQAARNAIRALDRDLVAAATRVSDAATQKQPLDGEPGRS